MAKRIMFKVEKGRVLVPVGEPCSFGCRYCYTRGGEVGLSRVDPEEVLTQFYAFARGASFETIQFGYDGDPFANPARGLAMLQRLSLLGKHVNFSTKGHINETGLAVLAEIQHQMQLRHTTLSTLVSLSCWDSASIVEPHTPSPIERIRTVASIKSLNIPVFIAVRPILPHIPDSEYVRLITEVLLAKCDGFILGPLYVDDRGQFARFIPSNMLRQTPCRKTVVSWSAHAPTWTRYEDEARLHRLAAVIEKKGGRVFFSSADAMADIIQRSVVA
ncbi:radical SAM protein [Ktedonospora formicarum]|uniref:radical SAM protein n=1 Tax=Ktedonospora formicarum TaxID=2778364 RepID=UPI001C6926A0|nr:radical SAM protein [Ktedonospora formicarum]